ncbi:MAG TPA: acireductone synthase, partial [Candidatus Udaeobacter sp.]
PPALKRWKERGIDVRIYSSGSIAAQKLFFGHTEFGDLLPYLDGHYDTTVGAKRDSKSYAAIAMDMKMPPGEILFLSDVAAELDAAQNAGLQTGLVIRPGNAPTPLNSHPILNDFEDLLPIGNKTT